MSFDVAVIGAGVVGSATALALARRGAEVALLEAEPEPGLAASGTNSGILHTGFDSPPGELETELILRAAQLREELLPALGVPVRHCGAMMRPGEEADRRAIADLAENARGNGVEVSMRGDGSLEVPGEAITDPVACTRAYAGAAAHQGATVRTGYRIGAIENRADHLLIDGDGGEPARCRVVVNCAGLNAANVAALLGDRSFDVYPRKGEFFVFDPPPERFEQILLPVPSKRTKGVLVFPTLDGMVVAGPTAVDQEDPEDWSVRPAAREEVVSKAARMLPVLEGAEPVASYAGLRPAGRGVNYLIGISAACPRLVNVAAIRSTGLTAAPAIAERVCELVPKAGVSLGPERPLAKPPARPAGGDFDGPWWQRTAAHRAGG